MDNVTLGLEPYAKNFFDIGLVNTPQKLHDYICLQKLNGTVVEQYVPTCPFPYINSGWGEHGSSSGFEDVVMGDCSITWAEAFPVYSTKCYVYIFLNIVSLLVGLKWMSIFAEKRKNSKAKTRATAEILTMVLCVVSFVHAIICIDMNAQAATHSYLFISILKGFCAAMMLSVCALLITSWVTIVDSGKSKVTPPWCVKALHASVVIAVVFEVGGAVTEILVGPGGWAVPYEGGYNGTVNACKGFGFALVMVFWAVICYSYGSKISKQLAAGGSGGSANAVIKKYLRTCMFCVIISICYKALFGTLRIGTTVFEVPPCVGGAGAFVDIISLLFLIIQFAILIAQNPSKGKAKAKVSADNTVVTSTSSTGEK